MGSSDRSIFGSPKTADAPGAICFIRHVYFHPLLHLPLFRLVEITPMTALAHGLLLLNLHIAFRGNGALRLKQDCGVQSAVYWLRSLGPGLQGIIGGLLACLGSRSVCLVQSALVRGFALALSCQYHKSTCRKLSTLWCRIPRHRVYVILREDVCPPNSARKCRTALCKIAIFCIHRAQYYP